MMKYTMILAKKLIYVPFFLIVFGLLIYQINPVLKTYDLIFSLSINSLVSLIILSALVSLTSFIFVLFASLSLDWKVIVPIGVFAALIPLIFLNPALGLVFAAGVLVSLLLTLITLENTMKTYLTFQPATLLGPSIRHLCSFLILAICVTYFLSVNKVIQETGFQIPDSLLETAIKFTPESQPEQVGVSQLSKAPEDLTGSLIKQAAKDQIQNFLKPYLGFVPAVLAILLFLTLLSLTSIINLLIYPLLWGIFYILEKTGFIKFTVEQRPVKKMVV